MNFSIKLGLVIVFCLATLFACTGGGGGGGGDDDDDPICTDADTDGYFAESGCGTLVDCDDDAIAINPGAAETCNGVDDNCSGVADEGVTTTYYEDNDGDTYGNASVTTEACSAPAGYVSDNTDCNDSAIGINPGATETCNGVDDNCSGGVDEGVTTTYYQDDDGDTYGNASVTAEACSALAGYVSDNTDCNDSATGINPGAAETCNGVDDNCSGGVDEGVTTTYYQDDDGDTYGNASVTAEACFAPTGYVSDSTDCNDSATGINPGAAETCNGVDDNCNGEVDEGVTTTYYQDDDGDTYGNASVTAEACSAPAGYVSDNTDCDDSTAAANPGITEEICNDGYDNDCNNLIDCGDTVACTDHPACNTFTNSLGMTFNLIPAGTFTMGSPDGSSEFPIGSGQTPPAEPGRGSDEEATEETLSQFYIQTTEVTQEQWNTVMGSNPSAFNNCGDDCPVEQISWNDVQTFITTFNALPAETGNTYRLPTEAEWEYAARAGSTTAFANGNITETDCALDDNLDALGWYCFNCEVFYTGCFDLDTAVGYGPICAGTNPVGRKDANAWGLYDMHGNLWEWCQDWYDVAETQRNIRGGSWGGKPATCRAANRKGLNPALPGIDVGFRLVLE